MHDAVADEELAALRAEIERLRALVGPSEQSYADLRCDLLAARDAARGAEASAGVLRGRVAELEVAVARARQDQDQLQQLVFDLPRLFRLGVKRMVSWRRR